MTNLHLTLKGDWVECHATKRACPRKFHIPNMTVAEIRQAPTEFLEQMLEIMDPPTYREGSKKTWMKNSYYHRDHDLPAKVDEDGKREWWMDNLRHREGDRPAIITADGTRIWYKDGRHHRDGDKPAVIQADGRQEWWQFGQQRRASKGPTVVLGDGTQQWKNGERLHRTGNQPAVIRADGQLEFWVNNKLHRTDGPAIEHPTEPDFCYYYLDGVEVTREEVLAAGALD